MPTRQTALLASLALLLLVPATGHGAPPPARTYDDPATVCAAAIQAEEQRFGIPRYLLSAIALAESGRWDDRHKATVAWPWTIMAEGNGQYFPTKAEALAAARRLRARGVRNMDVGCMQINMLYHGEHFASLEDAFEPAANVRYAGRFLSGLHRELGSWHEAAGRYHSATPKYNIPYKRKIARLWDDQRESGGLALVGLPPAHDPSVSTASTRAGSTPARPAPTAVQPAGRTIVPVDHARMARLTNTWRARTGRSQVTAAGNTVEHPTTGLRTGRRAATFAAKRRQYLQAWRQNRTAIAMN